MNDDIYESINGYKTMWIYAMFDLPVETKAQRKAANRFRKDLLNDGFVMLQFSVYIRHCASRENRDVHIKRVKEMIPPEGMVSILSITDKQFAESETLYGGKRKPEPPQPVQLELF